MTTMTTWASKMVPEGASFVEVPATAGARWLAPSLWPKAADLLFRCREPDPVRSPAVVTRYRDVQAILLEPGEVWRREIPLSVMPREARHCILGASWMRDGRQHQLLRRQIGAVNRGFSPEARQFTRVLAGLQLRRLLRQPPPWNLAPLIDEVSIRTVIEYTLAAPPLLPYTVRLRELTRGLAPRRADDGTDVLAYFQTSRQVELEKILAAVAGQAGCLPPGLARHLARVTDRGAMTIEQFVSQLGMLIVSSESQAAAAASLIGMLLEHGLLERARQAAADPAAMGAVVAEGARRAISFPINMVFPSRPVSLGGRGIAAGEPVVISYASANMDPAVFGPGAAGFDPWSARRRAHLAFGTGIHHCQGARRAVQFMEDILQAVFDVLRDRCDQLPHGIRLGHGGEVLREVTGVSWAIADLPAEPADRRECS